MNMPGMNPMQGLPPMPPMPQQQMMPQMDPLMQQPAMGMMSEPSTTTPLGGMASAPNTAIDQQAMGMQPTAPSDDALIMSTLQAVLNKWATGGAQIAGEKNSLLQSLMMIASAQPPAAAEAFVEGGSTNNFGMVPPEAQMLSDPDMMNQPLEGGY